MDRVKVTEEDVPILYHATRPWFSQSIIRRGLMPGGQKREGRVEVYFSPMSITDDDTEKWNKAGCPATRLESGVVLALYPTHGERSEIVEIDTKFARERGCKFAQSSSATVLTFEDVPPQAIICIRYRQSGQIRFTGPAYARFYTGYGTRRQEGQSTSARESSQTTSTTVQPTTPAAPKSSQLNVDMSKFTNAVEKVSAYPSAPWRSASEEATSARESSQQPEAQASSSSSSAVAQPTPAIIVMKGGGKLDIDGCIAVDDNEVIPVDNLMEALMINQQKKIDAEEEERSAQQQVPIEIGDESMEDEDCLETCIHCEARLSHPMADSCRKCGKLQFTSAESTSARESSQTAHSTGPEEAEPANVPQPMEGVVEENATERAPLWTPKPIIEDAAKKNEIEMETPEILAAEKKVRDNSSKRRKWDDLDEGTKQFHVSELALLCTTRAKHKKTLDDYITNLARLKSIPTQNMPTLKEELDVQIAVVENYIKSGNEFMSRIMKMAEYYMRDSPLLNEQWEKEAVGSETSETRAPSSSFVGSCEHAASQVSDELDAIGHLDTSNEKMTYKVSKIIADQIVPQSLYKEFNYESDEILPASIEILKHEDE